MTWICTRVPGIGRQNQAKQLHSPSLYAHAYLKEDTRTNGRTGDSSSHADDQLLPVPLLVSDSLSNSAPTLHGSKSVCAIKVGDSPSCTIHNLTSKVRNKRIPQPLPIVLLAFESFSSKRQTERQTRMHHSKRSPRLLSSLPVAF